MVEMTSQDILFTQVSITVLWVVLVQAKVFQSKFKKRQKCPNSASLVCCGLM
jgi:hypothetical protein